MEDLYQLCHCGSGKKLKFCCYKTFRESVNQDPLVILQRASTFKVCRCLICKESLEAGLKAIVVARLLPNLRYLYASYIVDTYCLGLKDTLCRINADFDEIQHTLEFIPAEWIDCNYEVARTIILGGIAYASSLGFAPNEDWSQSKYVIEFERPYAKNYEFGREGKPFYVQGPNDDADKIMRQLKNKTKGDFHYIISPEGFFEDAELL